MLSASQVIAIRKLMKWTQRDLAQRIGVSASTVAFIEMKRRAARDTADRLWQVIDQAGIKWAENGDPFLKPAKEAPSDEA
jgi:transcriptional regulator with XRE-family HTH domain